MSAILVEILEQLVLAAVIAHSVDELARVRGHRRRRLRCVD